MPISLENESTNYPGIKFETKGEFVEVACCRIETIPMTAMGTNDYIVGKDGKTRTQDRITGIVIVGTAKIKDGEAMREVNAGDMVSLYIKGLSRWEFFEAKKAQKPDRFEVGDHLTWTFTGTKPGQVAGTTKKLYTVVLGKPEDPDMTTRCEAEYHRLTGAVAASAETDPFAEDEE